MEQTTENLPKPTRSTKARRRAGAWSNRDAAELDKLWGKYIALRDAAKAAELAAGEKPRGRTDAHARPGDSSGPSEVEKLRNTVVEQYQWLVKDVVRRVASRLPRLVDRGDLITAGSMGLISAVEGFDQTRGVAFEIYCERRVRGALLDEMRTQDWLPRPWRHRLVQQKRAVERLRSELEREPADEEVAAVLEMSLDEYMHVFGTGILNAPTGSMPSDPADGESSGVLEEVSDPSSEAPSERLTREEMLSLITQKLTAQEIRVVYLRYWEDLSMREIGELTGISESRVCKIHARLLERLRDRLHADEQQR